MRPDAAALLSGQTEDRSAELAPFLRTGFDQALALDRAVGGDCSAEFTALAQLVAVEIPAHGSTAAH